MKSILHLSIDTDLLKKVKRKFPNGEISGFVEDVFRKEINTTL